jgi:hypothetical protein
MVLGAGSDAVGEARSRIPRLHHPFDFVSPFVSKLMDGPADIIPTFPFSQRVCSDTNEDLDLLYVNSFRSQRAR